jgi:hypothetical protein
MARGVMTTKLTRSETKQARGVTILFGIKRQSKKNKLAACVTIFFVWRQAQTHRVHGRDQAGSCGR